MEQDLITLYKGYLNLLIKLDNLLEKEKNEEYEILFKKETEKDGLFCKFNKLIKEIRNQSERRKLMEKYNDKIELPFKEEIIYEIRKEVRLKAPTVTPEELNIFSLNVYILSCLLAQNIDDQEAINRLNQQNAIYFEESQEKEDSEIYRQLDFDLKYLTYLKEKYTNLIKEKLEESAI